MIKSLLVYSIEQVRFLDIIYGYRELVVSGSTTYKHSGQSVPTVVLTARFQKNCFAVRGWITQCLQCIAYGLDCGRIVVAVSGTNMKYFLRNIRACSETCPYSSRKGIRGYFCGGEKWLKREAGHPPPSSTEVKNVWSFTSLLSVLHDVVLN
jgi:hypothetical protein